MSAQRKVLERPFDLRATGANLGGGRRGANIHSPRRQVSGNVGFSNRNFAPAQTDPIMPEAMQLDEPVNQLFGASQSFGCLP